MRKLSASELRLSAALGAALLIALLAFVGKWYLTRVAALRRTSCNSKRRGRSTCS